MSHADIQALYILHYFSYIVGGEEDIAVFHNVKELINSARVEYSLRLHGLSCSYNHVRFYAYLLKP